MATQQTNKTFLEKSGTYLLIIGVAMFAFSIIASVSPAVRFQVYSFVKTMQKDQLVGNSSSTGSVQHELYVPVLEQERTVAVDPGTCGCPYCCSI